MPDPYKHVNNVMKSTYMVIAAVVVFFVVCFAIAAIVFPANGPVKYEATVDDATKSPVTELQDTSPTK